MTELLYVVAGGMVLVQAILEVRAVQAGADFPALNGGVNSALLLHPWRHEMSVWQVPHAENTVTRHELYVQFSNLLFIRHDSSYTFSGYFHCFHLGHAHHVTTTG